MSDIPPATTSEAQVPRTCVRSGALVRLAVVAAMMLGAVWLLLDALGWPLPPVPALKYAGAVLLGSAGLAVMGGALVRPDRTEDGERREAAARFVEHFTVAVSRLGEDSAAMRMGGVHALAHLADDTPDPAQRQMCIDVLCAYLRLPFEPESDRPEESAEPEEPTKVRDRHLELAALCEVRRTVVGIIRSRLRADTPWRAHDYDLTGAAFDHFDLSGAVCNGRMIFANAVFSGVRANFADAVLSGARVDFSGATFSCSQLNFNSAKVSSAALDFTDAEFASERSSFNSVAFSGDRANFLRARFTGDWVSFVGARFSGRQVDFAKAVFSGWWVSFAGAVFSGDRADFTGAKFSGDRVILRHTVFSGDRTDFTHATFSAAEVTFNRAAFSGDSLSFMFAEFSGGWISFAKTAISGGEASFSRAVFSGRRVSFADARFSGNLVDFAGSDSPSTSGADQGACPDGLLEAADRAIAEVRLRPAWTAYGGRGGGDPAPPEP